MQNVKEVNDILKRTLGENSSFILPEKKKTISESMQLVRSIKNRKADKLLTERRQLVTAIHEISKVSSV